MSMKYGILNFLILILVLFFSLKSYEVWTQPIKVIPEKNPEKELKNKLERPISTEKENPSPSVPSSTAITEKNIFSPERKDFPSSAVGQAHKPTARPQIILYGVTIVEDYQSATIVQPGRLLRKEERESITLKIGEKIGGYKLAKVLPDRVTMEALGDSFDVLLYDPKNPKKRTEIRTADVKPDQPLSVATVEELSPIRPKVFAEKTEERLQEHPSTPIRTVLSRQTNFPNRSLARQSRSALISQPNTLQK